MASAAVSVAGSSPGAAAAMARDHRAEGMRRSESGTDLSGMRRSMSAPQLRCSLNVPRAAAPASLKSSRSIGVFPLGSIITNSIRSFLFDSGEGVTGGGMRLVEPAEESDEEVVAGSEEEGIGQEKRANWVARILELRRRWRDRQHKVDGVEEEDKEGGEEDGYCGVSYESEEEEEGEWDRESFESLLGRVPWSDEKLFSQLAFLCDMAYVIPEIKVSSPLHLSRPFRSQRVSGCSSPIGNRRCLNKSIFLIVFLEEHILIFTCPFAVRITGGGAACVVRRRVRDIVLGEESGGRDQGQVRERLHAAPARASRIRSHDDGPSQPAGPPVSRLQGRRLRRLLRALPR